MSSTTATRAIRYETGEPAEIIMLGGQHPRAREGVRVVVSGSGESLPGLSLTTIMSILGQRRADASIWAPGLVWTISEVEADALRSAAAPVSIPVEITVHRDLCPRCGSYCYGDCTAR